MPGLHFHDLRHTGNTLAATSGVSTRDLMARMGHDSINAAIIYQHATREADRTIASSLDAQVKASRARKARKGRRSTGRTDKGDDPEDGAAGALVPAS